MLFVQHTRTHVISFRGNRVRMNLKSFHLELDRLHIGTSIVCVTRVSESVVTKERELPVM